MISSTFAGFNPYIFKAYYDYIVDNEDTPHLLVNPKCAGVVLPSQFTATDELILSVSPMATRHFDIGPRGLSFETRFSGKICSVFLPYSCIQELIATESKIAIPIRVFFVADGPAAPNEESSDSPDFEVVTEQEQSFEGSDLGGVNSVSEPAFDKSVIDSTQEKKEESGEDPDFTIVT